MSRRINKNTVQTKCCVHCKNRGKTRQIYESHNVLNDKGFVCCPDILSNRCSKCNIVGHLPSRCVKSGGSIKGFRISIVQPNIQSIQCSNAFGVLIDESDSGDKFSTPLRIMKAPSSPPPLYRNKAPASLRMDLIDSGLEDDAPSIKPMRLCLDDCPANVTIRTKPKPKKPVCWADMSDEDDDKPGPWSKLDSW